MSTTIEPPVPECCAGGLRPAGATAPAVGAQRQLPRRLRADCLSDPSGGLTFSVPSPGGAPARDAVLLLRRRGGARAGAGATAPQDTVRLPLVAGGPGGSLRAVLPESMLLPEGRWDVHLSLGEREQRLLPGVNDLRSLVGRIPDPNTPIAVRLPYATRFGNLTVRAWTRRTHAEAGQLRVVGGGMVLDGRLYGAVLSGTARLEARPRGAHTGVEAVTTAAAALPGGRDETGTAFTAELSYAALTDAGVWDLWLLPGADGKAVRIARILDDIQDKKRVFRYPSQWLMAGPGEFAVRPYYTLDNDLAVRVDRIQETGAVSGW